LLSQVFRLGKSHKPVCKGTIEWQKLSLLGVHIVDVLGRPVSEIPPGQNLAIFKRDPDAGASVDMAKLGLEVIAMGAIGNDEIGEFLLGVMQRWD
jgi:sugar/nucleoside kinase (ribokinase family)